MTIFQMVATLFALFMMYVVRIHGQKRTIGPTELSLWYTIWVLFIVISIFPDLLLGIVGVLHFARVFDLLLVMALMVLTVVIFLSYFTQKAAMQKLERFVNLQAVISMEEKLDLQNKRAPRQKKLTPATKQRKKPAPRPPKAAAKVQRKGKRG